MLTFIHTFDSAPMLKNKFLFLGDYDKTVQANIIDYTYSAYCIKSLPDCRVVLYADPQGAEILNHIPYNEVRVLKDFQSNIDFAAAIKFEAIKHMTQNDILIDGDLFIQKPECLDIIRSYDKYDFVYSFYEPTSFIIPDDNRRDFYKNMLDELSRKTELFEHPYKLPELSDIAWPNTSFMKFNNQELKQKYIEQYAKFKNGLSGLNFDKSWPDVIIEQYHMGKLLADGGYSSKPMVEDFPTPQSNAYALSIGFTHLGGAKRNFTEIFASKIAEKFGIEVLEQAQNKIKELLK